MDAGEDSDIVGVVLDKSYSEEIPSGLENQNDKSITNLFSEEIPSGLDIQKDNSTIVLEFQNSTVDPSSEEIPMSSDVRITDNFIVDLDSVEIPSGLERQKLSKTNKVVQFDHHVTSHGRLGSSVNTL